jgi:hypothetical protein
MSSLRGLLFIRVRCSHAPAPWAIVISAPTELKTRTLLISNVSLCLYLLLYEVNFDAIRNYPSLEAFCEEATHGFASTVGVVKR